MTQEAGKQGETAMECSVESIKESFLEEVMSKQRLQG